MFALVAMAKGLAQIINMKTYNSPQSRPRKFDKKNLALIERDLIILENLKNYFLTILVVPVPASEVTLRK